MAVQLYFLLITIFIQFSWSKLVTKTFDVNWYDGREHLIEFNRTNYGDCLFTQRPDVLTCMRTYSFHNISRGWKYDPNSIQYVSVRCHQQTYFRYHQNVCMCKNGTGAANPVISQQYDRYYFCQITTLPTDTFEDLHYLEVIDLQDNSINRIEIDAFKNTISLRYLNLGGNPFNELPGSMLCDRSDLEVLIMDKTQLRTFPAQIFDCGHQQNDLVYIDMSNGIVNNVPRTSFKNLHNLKSLNFSGNNLDFVHPMTFQPITKLQYLDLSANKFAKFPEGLCEPLESLVHVRLYENEMTTLNLTNLRECNGVDYLDLSRNRIRLIVADQSNSTINLRHLNVSHNTIKELKGAIFRIMDQLSVLDISNNNISTISSEAFNGLGDLKTLNLSNNAIGMNGSVNNLEHIFNGLSNLTEMHIKHNKLTTIPEGMFKDLGKVEYLDISWNLITTLVDNSFLGLLYLKHLDLSHNMIKSIQTNMFVSTPNLIHLDLSFNVLTHFDSAVLPLSLHTVLMIHNEIKEFPKSFQNSNVSYLDLSSNSISRLTYELLENVTSVEHLDISDNQLISIEKYSFSDCENIQYLTLEQNLLNCSFDEYDMFKGLINIQYLDISFNRIQSLRGIFDTESLKSLKTFRANNNPIGSLLELRTDNSINHMSLADIYVSYCDINSTDINTFTHFDELKKVDISNNKIKEFQPFNISSGVHFNMAANPLICNCRMDWLVRSQLHLYGRRISQYDYAVTYCAQYPDMVSKPARRIPLYNFLCQTGNECDELCTCYSRTVDGPSQNTSCSGGLTAMPVFVSAWTKHINLDGNRFGVVNTDISRGVDMLAETIYINNSGIESINSDFFNNFIYVKFIDLSNNKLTDIQPFLFLHQKELTVLKLSHNYLTSFSKHAFDGLTSIRRMDLSNNEIQILDSTSLAEISNFYRTFLIKLAGNPYTCKCANKDFHAWIGKHRSRIADRRDLKCTKNGRRQSKILDIEIKCSRRTPTSVKETPNRKGIIVTSIILCLAFCVLCAASFYYRRDLVAVMYGKLGWGCLRTKFDNSKLYDTFIIYDTNDNACAEWVGMTLLRRLQKIKRPKSYRVIVPEKVRLMDGVADIESHQIYDCKTAIFVLTSNFAGNNWTTECYRKALAFQSENNLFKIILLTYGNLTFETLEPEMKNMLRKGNYITGKSRTVYDRLLYELPEPEVHESVAHDDDVSETDVIIYNASGANNIDDYGTVCVR